MPTMSPMLAQTDLWISNTSPSKPARIRLFCFPFAGGGANAFRGWTNLLPTDIQVCAVQLPGREKRFSEPPALDLMGMVEELTTAMVPLLDQPFALFGHSLGAIVAFEVARQLRRIGVPPPAHLFASGHGPKSVEQRKELFHKMPEPQFIATVSAFGGLPEAVLQNRELLQLVVPLLKADFELYETYQQRADAPLHIPITALGGLQDKAVPEHHLLAWSRETLGEFKLRMFPGGHFFLQQQTHVLLHLIARELMGSLS